MRPHRTGEVVAAERFELRGRCKRVVVSFGGDVRQDEVGEVVDELVRFLDRPSQRDPRLHVRDCGGCVAEKALRVSEIGKRGGLESRKTDVARGLQGRLRHWFRGGEIAELQMQKTFVNLIDAGRPLFVNDVEQRVGALDGVHRLVEKAGFHLQHRSIGIRQREAAFVSEGVVSSMARSNSRSASA